MNKELKQIPINQLQKAKWNKIHLGDCLELIKKLPDNSIDAIVTDPPYLYLKHKLERPFDELALFTEFKRVLKDGKIVMFGRGSSFYRWNTILEDLGFNFKEEIIWNKRHNSTIFNSVSRVHETIAVYSDTKLNEVRVDYLEAKKYDIESIVNDIKRIRSAFKNPKEVQELIKYFVKNEVSYKSDVLKYAITASGGKKTLINGLSTVKATIKGLKLKSIIEENREHYQFQHPTQKPVKLLQKLIKLISNENDTILDSFIGGGSTAIACMNTNRNYIGYEIDKEYYEVAKKRIGTYHGDLFKDVN